MKLRSLITGIFSLFIIASVAAQESDSIKALEQRTSALEAAVKKLSNFKVSGYVQGQYQLGEKESLNLKVGDPINENPGEESINRMGIRRGRIKFAYEENIYMGVFQLDITEKGVGIKDAFFQVKDPWTKSSFLKAGVFDRPFGYEISYSSSKRESPERSTVFQTLFPEERDMGVSLTLQLKPTSPLDFLKLEAGIFAGNGIKIDSDNKKDFIGHLSASRNEGKNIKWGAGVSYYYGKVFNPTDKLYVMDGDGFTAESVEVGSFAKRKYIGFDAQFSIKTPIGISEVRAEYLTGTQPGTILSSKSPNYSTRTLWTAEVMAKDGDGLYKRNFNGYYIYLIQGLGKSPFSIVLKYDYYDPNTKLDADQVATGNNSSFADLAVQTFGFGGLWDMSKSFRVMAYYDINKNEAAINAASPHSVLYDHERKDNVFTLRLQYKF